MTMDVKEALRPEPVETDPLINPPPPLLHDQTKSKTADHSRTFLKLYATAFFVNLAIQILAPAQTQIYERIYCAQWYEQHPPGPGIPVRGGIPESYCKIGPVQTQVSSLKGYLEFFLAAPGLLLSIPMGMLTDVIGRRFILTANVVSLSLSQVWVAFVTWFGGRIPLRAVWLGGTLGFLTGGTVVTEMLFVCMFTDISPAERLAHRFFCVSAFGYSSKVAGPLIASALMRVDPWLAIYTGLGFLCIGVILVCTLPETLHATKHGEHVEDDGEANANPDADAVPAKKPTRATVRQSIRQVLKIWSDWRLVFVALTYPFKMVCYALGDLVQRYVSDRYGWTLADATLVYSVQAAAAAVILWTILPLASNHIDRRSSFSTIQKNAALSRAALLVLVVAYALIGLAPNIAVMFVGLLIETLSTGLPATMRALAAAMVHSDDKGSVFSVMAITETLSTMIAYPITATLFNIGLEKGGGPWLGLPYDVMSVAAGVTCLGMCLLSFERGRRHSV